MIGQSGLEYLSGEYNRGFTNGIISIQNVFKYIQQDLKYHNKKLTIKLINELLQCCLENREKLRESVNGFIRWNGKQNSFEFYEEHRNKNNE